MPQIRIIVGDRVIDAELNDSATARDLAARLPLTLPFRDFGGQEKVADLDPPLTMDGVPSGDDPDANDIGYYAPTRALVLYCADVGHYEGIVRLGRVAVDDMAFLRDQPDGFTATIQAG